MTSIPTVSLSVLLASAAAAVIAVTMRPTPPVVPADTNADLQAELLALRQSQAALQQELAQLRTAPAAVAAGPQRIAAGPSDEQIAAAVEAYLQRRTAASGVVEAASAAPFDLDSDFASLQGANFWDDSSLWKRAFAAGRMDDVIARFESLAKANRHDVQAQMDLARAYMAYQQMDPSKWQLSVKADQVFDDVLEIDENHWEARFTKAVSYTFWPDFLGKKKDAIAHFETLVQQQEVQPAQPHQAQTYLYLGNLLEQTDPKRAAEIWAQGLRRHPNDPALSAKAGR
jgi:tetratricopeptide (TPR) repeat protein